MRSVDEQGVLTALNVAAPVLEGHEATVEHVLELLPEDRSPLAHLGTVHFGRWSLFPDWPATGQTTLWFSADFEGTVEQFAERVCSRMPDEAEAIWSHCVEWPGVGDPAALERWILDLRIPTHYFLAINPGATLADCESARTWQRSFAEFAIEAQSMDRAGVRAGFRERFGDLGA